MLLGLSSSSLDQHYAAQQDSLWCWAASLQMIFRHYGIRLSQERIVSEVFGTTPWGSAPNKAADFLHITRCLNRGGVDQNGRRYHVRSHLLAGAPDTAVLAEELAAKRPVLLSYQSRPNMNHAVVISGMELSASPQGLLFQRMMVRDPNPQARNRARKGRRVVRPSTLLSKAAAHWIIRVR